MAISDNEVNFTEELSEWIHAADLGIEHVTLEKNSSICNTEYSGVSESRSYHKYYNENIPSLIQNPNDMITSIKTWHKSSDGNEIQFDLIEEESSGTNRFVALTALWLLVIKNNRILVIDELETKLHPLMTRFLIETIHKAGRAQLIFTTHDSSLLDAKLFCRDQICFTEKDTAGATHLYSLWDYDVRKEENFRNGYLKGRYGAIPFIGELNFD